mgnify:CR=1 FL=1
MTRRRFLLTASGLLIPAMPKIAVAQGPFVDFRPKTVKPPFGAAQINWGHPLARGLRFFCPINEGVPHPIDLVQWVRGTGAASLTVSSQHGGSLAHVATNGYVDFSPANPPSVQITGPLTIVAGAEFNENLSNAPILCRWGTDEAYLLTVSYLTTNKLLMSVRVAETSINAESAGTYADGHPYYWCGVFDGANVRLRGFRKDTGVLVENVTGTATTGPIDNPASGVNLRLGNYNNQTTVGFIGRQFYAAIWARALPLEEMQRIVTEPYAFLQPIPAVTYVFMRTPAAGAGVTPLRTLMGVGR